MSLGKSEPPTCRCFFLEGCEDAEMHYYKFNIADYRKDTGHLSTIEHGIFRQLIDWYYLDEQPISLETQVVSRRLRLGSDDLIFLENVLSDFFQKTAKGYVHKRIEFEIHEYHEQAEKNKVNGKRGGRPKKTQSVISGLPDESQNNPNQEPLTINQEPLTIVEKKQRGSRLPTDFEIPDDWVSFCQTERPDLNPYKVFEIFKDYWLSAVKGTRLDWKATWRNWVRTQKVEKSQDSFFERDQKLKRERMKEFTPHVAGPKKIDPSTGFFIEEVSDVYAITSR
jgi:uncharacterized protein YdaU (DUF1376 family)